MILVTLGTQDKDFSRLLKVLDKEIEKGHIKEKVIVQSGNTKYKSDNMEIFDFVSNKKLEELISESRLIITHGGVGSILSALKNNKKVIATPRLAKYKEHHNDHQKQIVKEFAKRGYILELKDFNKIEKVLEKSKVFKPKKYTSNTKNMVNMIDDYIKEDNHISWVNKFKSMFLYLLFGFLTTVINIVAFYLLDKVFNNIYISNIIAWIISVAFAFITNKLLVFESKSMDNKLVFKESVLFIFFRVLSLLIEMVLLGLLVKTLFVDKIVSKVITNIVVIILNYIFSKLIIFKNNK
ncbi:MAG: GtrA family protein [Bacilli bacterium]|nr:GtrA family protein [Bacilli bacterium]MBR3049572.1 GtrA family protein [Bacilli bacterium]